MTIHFICRGNAHRSVIAEAYLKSLHLEGVSVYSSGTVANTFRTKNKPLIQHVAVLLEEDHGIGRYVKKRADQLTQERVDSADVTICMNQIVKDECDRIVKMPTNTVVWDITDSGEGDRTMKPGEHQYKYTEEIYQDISRDIDRLRKELNRLPVRY